ncbi:tubulin-like doman-containing protein [Crocosphaera sp. Alani8]|uniref:tubulin-like doman-containing protein n=1 Tax=Crocosphaera sp. Alani8 TaxID=3038952 RepID=UPI00313C2675
MTMYVIGIGGTGSKCVEALTKLAAVGLLGKEKLKVLYIDADETNGNLERSRKSLNNYIQCHNIVSGRQEQHWMATPIETYDLWSPFTAVDTGQKLQDFFNYNNLKQENPVLGHFFDVLYTKDEQEVSLDMGFLGRPAIGAAVMSQLNLHTLKQEPWKTLIADIERQTSPPKLLFCGSIFGGTGASGLPTIARLVANKLEEDNHRRQTKIAALLLLPYFGFSTPPGTDPQGIYVRSEQFLLNTEAALRYYKNQAQETFDTVFLLGNPTLSKVNFSMGKNNQCNHPHFLELFAGLAARHFNLNAETLKDKVVLLGGKEVGRLTWDDIPDHLQVQPALSNGIRFAYTWLAEIVPELAQLLKTENNRQIFYPWLLKFFPRDRDFDCLNNPQEQQALTTINDWCKDYLTWWYTLHQEEKEQIQLFNTGAFPNPETTLKREKLSELVYGSDSNRSNRAKHTIQGLKRQLQKCQPDPSAKVRIIELARTLYRFCQL